MITTRPIRRRRSVAASLALLATTPLVVLAGGPAAQAAGSKACDGGGFTVLGKSAATGFDGAVAAPASRFSVQGKYTRLDIEPADFAVYDYGFLPALPTRQTSPADGPHLPMPARSQTTVGLSRRALSRSRCAALTWSSPAPGLLISA
jgi:hypothetical protein